MGRITATTRGGRRLTRMPSDHSYPVRQKLKDYGMMQSFMTSGPLTWVADPDEGPDESGATPFPEENVAMMVFEGHPLFGGRRLSNLGPRISTRDGWGRGGSRA
jgi:hypothetical protein